MNDANELVDFEVVAVRPKRKKRKSRVLVVALLAAVAAVATVIARRAQAQRAAEGAAPESGPVPDWRYESPPSEES